MDEDFWLSIGANDSSERRECSDESLCSISEITNVLPLTNQLGQDEIYFVPTQLRTALFSAVVSERRKRESTYLVLDGAQVPHLPEILETSELDHACLFKGAAYAELKDTGPWIIRLNETSKFTKNLFTHSESPLHLWGTKDLFFFRSVKALPELQSHLRKFLRLQNPQGKWFYCRFWSNAFMTTLMGNANSRDQHTLHKFLEPISALLFPSEAPAIWNQIEVKRMPDLSCAQIGLDDQLRVALNHEIDHRKINHEIDELLDKINDGQPQCVFDKRSLLMTREWLITNGFTQFDQRRKLFQCLQAQGLLSQPDWPHALKLMLSDATKGTGIRLWLLDTEKWRRM